LNVLLPLIFWAFTLVIIAFLIALFYYLIFSHMSPVKKMFMEKKINKLINSTKNFDFIEINRVTFFYDKDNNKIIKI